jgi:type IV pilus assembly protein PilQ
MSINSFTKFFGIIILGLFLSGCSTQFAKKYNPPFKHNTPLIKDNIKKDGKAEIQKTLELGPKPAQGKKVY